MQMSTQKEKKGYYTYKKFKISCILKLSPKDIRSITLHIVTKYDTDDEDDDHDLEVIGLKNNQLFCFMTKCDKNIVNNVTPKNA